MVFDCAVLTDLAGRLCLPQDGWTPLCAASSRGHLPVVSALLERGANVESADKVRSHRGDSYVSLCPEKDLLSRWPAHMRGGV